jgi:hypothetical protein
MNALYLLMFNWDIKNLTILFSVICIGIPLLLVSFMIIKPLIIRSRYSKQVIGKVVDVYSSDNYHRNSDCNKKGIIAYIATCNFEIEETSYTVEVVSRKKIYVSAGDELVFYINPRDPFNTYLKDEYDIIKYIVVATVAINLMVYVLPITLKSMIIGGDYYYLQQEEWQKEQIKEEKWLKELEEKRKIEKEEKERQEAKEQAAKDMKEKIEQEKEKNESKDNDDMIINTKKPIKRVWSKNTIKKVDMAEGVSFYVPNSYKLYTNDDYKKHFMCEDTDDSLILDVGRASGTVKEELNEVIEDIKGYTLIKKITKIDTYVFNGNKMFILHSDDPNGTLHIVTMKEDIKIHISYRPDKKSPLDVRSILKTLKF